MMKRALLAAAVLTLATAAAASAQEPAADSVSRTIILNPRPTASIGMGVQFTPDDLWVVTRVGPDSPAQKAGLVVGDTIVRIDGRDVRAPGAGFRGVRPGQRIPIRVRRGGEAHDLVLVPGPPPPVPGEPVRAAKENAAEENAAKP